MGSITPEPQEGQQRPTTAPSVERKDEITPHAIDHTGPAAVANGESTEQCSQLWEASFKGDTNLSVAVKV
jgi:hypothetical protein